MKKQTKKPVVKVKKESVPEIPLALLPIRPKENRFPPAGSIITKTYHGKKIEVKVLEHGFEYQGKVYKSISGVAMQIVRRSISGYVFFGLKK